MTVEEARQIYYINIEIKTLQLELAKLEDRRIYYKNYFLSDMPKGSSQYNNPTDEYLTKRQELQDMLNYALRKLQIKRKEFEEFLQKVENAETRLILRLRCINNMRWEDIGKEIGIDRRTASRIFYQYFKE